MERVQIQAGLVVIKYTLTDGKGPPSMGTVRVVSLDGDRICDSDLHCHMRARHSSNAGMSQTFQHRACIGAAGVDDSHAR